MSESAFQLCKLGVDCGECLLDRFTILLEFLNAASSACQRTIIVVTWLLRTIRCKMPFLVELVAFLILPVLFVICIGVVAFSITIAASTTTALTTLLYEEGALRLCHSCDHSFVILVQKMQSLLAVIGIMIVSGGEVILKIHLEVTVLRSTLTKEGI
jgi:hypothetical protein